MKTKSERLLEAKLRKWNLAYRTDESIVTDETYDEGLAKLKVINPKNEFLSEIGYKEPKMEKLPVYMGSLDNIRTYGEIKFWVEKHHITRERLLILPKFDGMAQSVDEEFKRAWTRGNSTHGINVSEHFSYFNKNLISFPAVSVGEVIITIKDFIELDSKYKNPRSFVVGRMRKDVPEPAYLEKMSYMCFGIPDNAENFKNRREELCFANLNINNDNLVPFKVVSDYRFFDEKFLKDTYIEWSRQFPMDGLVIEVDSLDVRDRLGLNARGNPNHSIAYKGDFEEVKDTIVTNITWGVSKRNLLKPVAQVKPIDLDGATVTNINLDNARYVKENSIGVNTVISVKRSGMVIPRIVKVVSASGSHLPRKCPECGELVKWNETKVDLYCNNKECSGSTHKRISAFFKIIGVEDVAEGTFETVIDCGYDSIPKILDMTKRDFLSLPGFKDRKAAKTYNAINSAVVGGVTFPVLQHASGLFSGLGSTKLTDIENRLRPLYDTHKHFDLTEELLKVDGISDKTAEIFRRGSDQFYSKFLASMPTIKIITMSISKLSTALEGGVFVFTGFRDSDLEDKLISHGATIGTGVTKKTTHLVMKEVGSGSGKERRAIEYGCLILTKEELENKIDKL